jgi:hypothetical protein
MNYGSIKMMKLKAIIITLFITVPLLVNAKWVDLVCYPQLKGSHTYGLNYGTPKAPSDKCAEELIDRGLSSSRILLGDCYTWIIGFNSESSTAEVDSPIIKAKTYNLKKSSLYYSLSHNVDSSAKLTINVNRETLKYYWKFSTEHMILSNSGQCSLSNRETLI